MYTVIHIKGSKSEVMELYYSIMNSFDVISEFKLIESVTPTLVNFSTNEWFASVTLDRIPESKKLPFDGLSHEI